MGIEVALIASAAVGAASFVQGQEARKDQAEATRKQADTQRQMQSEQRAANTAQAAAERRQQIREARVRRARVMQSAVNTGAEGSSAEFGAVGGMATQLSSNIGANLGSLQTAGKLSELGQTAADFGTQANLAQIKGQNASSMFQLSSSIFSSLGGPEKTIKLIS